MVKTAHRGDKRLKHSEPYIYIRLLIYLKVDATIEKIA